MDDAELEGTALAAYKRAGMHHEEPKVIELARRIVGPVMVAHGFSLPGDAMLEDGRILVRPKARGWRLRWAVAHEVAEWLLELEGIRCEWQEALADRLAGSLLAPLPVSCRACRYFGPEFFELAQELQVHPYCAVLRFGEVTQVPVELRSARPRSVRRRGGDWPPNAHVSRAKVCEREARWVS